VPVFPRFFYNL